MLALVGLGWVAVWLWSWPIAALTVAVVCALGMAVSRRRPLLAAGLVLTGCILAGALGVPPENPGTLVPIAVVVFGLGRWAGWWAAVAGLLGLLIVWGWADALQPATMVFGAVLYGFFWGFGRLVAVKHARATDAQDQAARVGGKDPRVVAEAVVAEERVRLASEIARVVGTAVEAMLADVRLAGVGSAKDGHGEQRLDPVAIERIRVRGATGVAELRRLLGLLRQSPDVTGAAGVSDPGAAQARRRRWVQYVLTGGVLALGVVDLFVAAPGTPPALLVVVGLLPLVLLLQRTRLLVALLVAAGALGVVAAVHPTQLGLATVVLIVVMSWSAGVDGRRVVWLGWVLLAVTSGAGTLLASPDNVAMQLVVTLLAAWAGHAWSENDREQRSAQQATTHAQSELDRAVAEAVRQERLRVARDLHDVTSHALGVMVLQAGAANAQRLGDPARARASLALVSDVGSRAQVDLDRLVGLIDAGALGAATLDEPADLAGRLEALADRIRQTGARITLRTSRPPTDAETALVCYRVVQEALTNSVRHAPGSAVDVLVEGTDGGCQISVVDDGRQLAERRNDGIRTADRHGTGFGLIGAAERVSALHGEFTAGPEPAGGWVVRAWIPAQAGAAA